MPAVQIATFTSKKVFIRLVNKEKKREIGGNIWN